MVNDQAVLQVNHLAAAFDTRGRQGFGRWMTSPSRCIGEKTMGIVGNPDAGKSVTAAFPS